MHRWLGTALAALCLLAPAAAYADDQAPANSKEQREAALMQAYSHAVGMGKRGPARVELGDEATLQLPAHEVFVPRNLAAKLLTLMGNGTDERLLGMVLPTDAGSDNWMVVARYEDAGYIKDDDAKNWNADDLLSSLKEGTEAGNEGRRDQGIPEIEVTGWIEKPTYDAAAKRLVWSAGIHDKGTPADAHQSLNYNTYALGRDGYISLNLVTDMDHVAADKPIAKNLLNALAFKPGKRYADFNSSTDKIAEYGLAALVAGVAAKKLGLFAIAAAFALKFIKVIAIAVLAFFAGLRNKLSRKKVTPSPAPAPEAPPHEEDAA